MSKSSRAKEYIKDNKIDETVGNMVNTLLHIDTSNTHPIVFMIKYLSGLLSEDERQEYGINVTGPFPQKYEKNKKNILPVDNSQSQSRSKNPDESEVNNAEESENKQDESENPQVLNDENLEAM